MNFLYSVNERILNIQHSHKVQVTYKAGLLTIELFHLLLFHVFPVLLLGVGQDEGQAEQQQADVEDPHAGGAC